MENNATLLSHLYALLDEKKSLSFRDFMRLVLYDEKWGYYQQQRTKVGAGGDFITSPHVHPLFNQLLVTELLRLAALFNQLEPRSTPFTIVEVGAGAGELAAAIITSWQATTETKEQPLHYRILEKSHYHRQLQRERLSSLPKEGIQISWLDDWNELKQNPISGLIISHELFDALPAHLVVWDGGVPYELHIAVEGEDLRDGKALGWSKKPLSSNLAHRLQKWGIPPLEDGRRFPINLDAEVMLTNMAQSLKKGWIITIDYGDIIENLLEPKLYNPQHVIRCYEAHRLYTDPLERIGYRDITTDVNFTQLIQVGQDVGLENIALTTQASFLLQQGIGAIYAEMQRAALHDLNVDFQLPKVRSLFDLDGNGTRFKFLLQGKGWPAMDWHPWLAAWETLSINEMEVRIPYMPWGSNADFLQR